MDQHYICTGGCGGSSNEMGAVCEAENCPHKGQAMEPCDCTDGMHGQGSEQDREAGEGGEGGM